MNPHGIGGRPQGSAEYAHPRGLRGLTRVSVSMHLRAPRCLLWRGLSVTMVPMSKTIETTYRNGCIQLPDDVHLAEDTRVTVILPDNAMPKASPDSAYSIADLASDVGPEDLARNLEHYLYGQSKES